MVLPETNTTSVPNNPENQTSGTSLPITQKPIEANKSGVLPGTLLTQEDKSKASLAKEELNAQVSVIKKFVLIIILLSLAWAGWIKINISETNSVLSLVGVQMNAGQEAAQLKKEAIKAKKERTKIEKEIEKFNQQIENKNYTLYSEEIRTIQKEQIQWFDQVNPDGTIEFGIADAIPRMRDYFNSRTYIDPESIVEGQHAIIDIENLQVSREGVNFSVDSSQILGKIFYLNIEFVEMINSLPFLKNGKIEQFTRQQNQEEDDSMNFNIRLERQLADEEDPADGRFIEYLNWLKLSSQAN